MSLGNLERFRAVITDPLRLWVSRPSEGLSLDPRYKRSGYIGQPPGALVRDYSIQRTGSTFVDDPYLGFVTADTFQAQWKYSVDMERILPIMPDRHLGEGFRLECLASWKNTVTERHRQIKRSEIMDKMQLIIDAKSIHGSTSLYFKDFYQAMASFVLSQGDWSDAAFALYAREHRHASIGGSAWKMFYEVDRGVPVLTKAGKELYQILKTGVRKFYLAILNDNNWNEKTGLFINKVINPKMMYAAIRARPAVDEYNLLSGHAKITKYRDRNAAGVVVISQAGFPLMDEVIKHKFYDVAYGIMRRVLPKGSPRLTPEEKGLKAYTRLREAAGWVIFDTANAEKIEAQVVPLPTRTCLSVVGQPLHLGDTKISGDFFTRIGGQWAESVLVEAMIEMGYAKIYDSLGGGDNWAIRGKVDFNNEVSEVFSKGERWLGVTPQGEQGLRLVRDSAKTNFGLKATHNSYRGINTRIPASSLCRALLSLDVLSTNFWDLMNVVELKTSDLEFGGPLTHFEDRLKHQPSVKDFLRGVFDEVMNEEFIDLCDMDQLIFDDIDNPMPYQYEINSFKS